LSTLETIAFTFAEVFDVGFGFLNRAVPIFANLSGISARRRLCIYDQAFFAEDLTIHQSATADVGIKVAMNTRVAASWDLKLAITGNAP
jgi:hypothetical protein